MENGNKQYKKALKYYYDGEINKAMTYCSKCLSANPKHSAALSLRGLLLYFQGHLKEARKLWERNFKINGDEVAKKYLVDSRNDFEKMDIFDEAVEKMGEMNITLAIKLLLHCKKSDFNCLNVNQKLIECYLKKGEHEKIEELISEQKVVDKRNKFIRDTEKELVKVGVLEKESQKELMIKGGIGVAVVLAIVILGKSAINIVNYEGKKGNGTKISDKENESGSKENTTKGTDESGSTETDTSDTTKTTDQPFPTEEVSKLIKEEKIESLINIIEKYNKESLDLNDVATFNRGKALIEKQAVDFYVNRGIDLYDKKDYNGALEEYNKGLKYIDYSKTYDEVLVFRLASIYLELENIEEIIKYTDLLNKNYPDGGYLADTLFESAKLLENIDLMKAKEYAGVIKTKFPDSIYMNDIIKRILSK